MYLTALIIYIAILLGISLITSHKGNSNSQFFTANRNAPWWVVAFGMIGASLSGISVVSVPGMVLHSDWTYLQTCIGFFFGYLAVAYILLPLYYRLNLTSIYEYLNIRFDQRSQITGSLLFVVAKMISSATKLYVVVLVLQQFIFNEMGIPFYATAIGAIAIIWLYTFRAGMRTIIWTDALQTLFFIIAISLMMYEVYSLFGDGGSFSSLGDGGSSSRWVNLKAMISNSGYSNTFEFGNIANKQHFIKQFISGIFIVIVMTGLDQDMMQKNLACSSLKDSQRNMLSYGIAFIPVNLALLLLGTLMIIYSQNNGISLPDQPDKILPLFASTILSPTAGIFFILGIIAASFTSADSALTSITTTIYIDILKRGKDGATDEKEEFKRGIYEEREDNGRRGSEELTREKERNGEENKQTLYRQTIHFAVCVLFALVVVAFGNIQNSSIIDTIYTIVGYTYGPLLGLFCFGLTTKLMPRTRFIPFIAILSPLLCYIIKETTWRLYGYSFGYELLLLNGILTYLMLLIVSRKGGIASKK